MTDLKGHGKADLIGFFLLSKMAERPIVAYSNRGQTGISFLQCMETDVARFSQVDYLPLV
ncbi:MAG: hypothetical protein MK324_13285 [Pirellulales bacterium]|nr:hypothetical protein [Pirellulales bacterium]